MKAIAAIAGIAVVAGCTFTRSLEYLSSGSSDAGSLPPSGDGGGDAEPPALDVVAEAQAGPRNLAQDADHLYWSNADGTVMSAPKDGGSAQKIGAADATILWIAAESGTTGDLFLIVGDAVQRMPKRGGELTLVERDPPRPYALAVDEASIFVVHYDIDSELIGYLARFAKDGTNRTILSPDEATTVAVHKDTVVWAGLDREARGVIFEAPKSSSVDVGGFKTYHGGPGPNDEVYPDTPKAFAIDDDAIYYQEADAIFRLLRAEGDRTPSSVLEPSERGSPAAIALDDSNVYVVDQRDNGAILRIPKQGGSPFELAANQPTPTAVVVDEAAVYFTVQGRGTSDGAVYRVAK